MRKERNEWGEKRRKKGQRERVVERDRKEKERVLRERKRKRQ